MKIKKKFIWIGLIIIVIAVSIYYRAVVKTKAIVVDIEVVEKGSIKEYIEENAVVRLERVSEVYVPQGGKVVAVMAEIGDKVNKGDILIRLDEQELVTQIKSLELQKQAVRAKQEEAGKELTEAEMRKLEAQEKSAEIALDEAKRLAQNNKILYDAGAISKDTYESTLAALAAAEANYELIKSSIEIAQEGMSPQGEKLYDIQIEEIQMQIDLLQRKRGELVVKASIEGIVLEKDVEIGSVLQPGKKIFEIGNTTDMFLESDILVDEIAGVKEGAEVLIENKDQDIYGLKGTVRKIYPKAFSKISELGIEQKRIKTEISFIDSVSDLKPGYDMNIKIITASSENTLLINEKAVFEYQGKDYVFLNENGIARMKQIQKGLESEDNVEVLKGLEEGDEVILSPDEKIKEGIRIKGKM